MYRRRSVVEERKGSLNTTDSRDRSESLGSRFSFPVELTKLLRRSPNRLPEMAKSNQEGKPLSFIDCSAVATINSVHVSWECNSELPSDTKVRVAFSIGLDPLPIQELFVHYSTKYAEIHFLPPDCKVNVMLSLCNDSVNELIEGHSTVTESVNQTSAVCNPGDCDTCHLATQTESRHVAHVPFWMKDTTILLCDTQAVGDWVYDSPSDWFIMFATELWEKAIHQLDKESKRIRKTLETAYMYGLFTLEEEVSTPFYTCPSIVLFMPNPISRYCLDVADPSIKWGKSKKFKRYKDNFQLSLNFAFRDSLKKLIQFHSTKGTWFTPGMLGFFCELHRCEATSRIHQAVFELWEGDTLVAVTAGFATGRGFHDYSMATFVRDNRSCGTILSKAVAHLLHQCGYEIWYWGFKNDYMAVFDYKYGGCDLSREEFRERWVEPACSSSEHVPLDDTCESYKRFATLGQMIRDGNALIQPKQ